MLTDIDWGTSRFQPEDLADIVGEALLTIKDKRIYGFCNIRDNGCE